MDLIVKQYLLSNTFNDLEKDHGVCSRANATGDKVSLNYDMTMSVKGNELVDQCRGLIIRPSMKFDVSTPAWKDRIVGNVEQIAWPMNRFYNDGEFQAAEINWDDCSVLEKLDGTMIVLYWDELHGQWFVATRSVPEANLPFVLDHPVYGDMTFTELFWKAFDETVGTERDEMLKHFNKDLTYVFELTSPMNRIVVKYNDYRITLLAAKITSSGLELPIVSLLPEEIPLPSSWALRDASSIHAFVNQADPSKLEGGVAVDSKFNRKKFKNKAWVLSSKAKDIMSSSRRSALEAIIMGTMDDVLPLLEKDIQDQIIKMQIAVSDYFKRYDENFETFVKFSYGSRKTFAEQVMLSNDWTPAYFVMWEKRASSSLAWTRSMLQAGKMSSGSLDTILQKLKL